MGFAKYLPTISIADFKDYLLSGKLPKPGEVKPQKPALEAQPAKGDRKKMYIFSSAVPLINALKALRERNYTIVEVFTPVKLQEVETVMGIKKSPVTYWTAAGGVTGLISGFALTAGSVSIYDLIVGGKPVVSLVPFLLVMFELTVLFAAIFNLVAVLYYSRLHKKHTDPWYDSRFSLNKFGILIQYAEEESAEVDSLIEPFNPEEVKHEK